MKLVDIICYFKGHTWKFRDFYDGEEWPGATFFDDAVKAYFDCERCGDTDSSFVCWGTMADNEEGLKELRKHYEERTNL